MRTRRLPLRVSRHRERARRGPRVPARVGEERAARGRPPRRQRDARARSSCCTAHGIYVVGGIIVGNPDDTRESIEANLAFARRYVDWPYIQHPTPYPGTPMTKDFRERGLIVNDASRSTTARPPWCAPSISTADEIEFMRWRAERWMKVRHMPAVLAALPGLRAAARAARCSRTRSAAARGGRRSASRTARGVRALQGDPPRGAGVSTCGGRDRSGLGPRGSGRGTAGLGDLAGLKPQHQTT